MRNVGTLPMNDRRVVVTYLDLSEDDFLGLNTFAACLERITRLYEPDKAVCTAMRALLKFVHCLRSQQLNKNCLSAQAEIYYDVKTWSP